MKLYQRLHCAWFHPGSLQRAFHLITELINRKSGQLTLSKAIYLDLRIDIRSGDFIMMTSNGNILTNEELTRLFKDLEIVKMEFTNHD